MMLIGTASAQTIYKQIDDEGRVVFTDQPAPGLRTLATIEPSRPRAQQPAVDHAETEISPGAPVTAEPRTEITIRKSSGMAAFGPQERAVATYTVLNTPMAAQADAVEAARRARLGASKDTVGPVLVVHASPREQEQVIKKSGMDSMYFIWAATFFALAAGLLYVGWQVFRLILGTAFARWNVGPA